jgi:hypothetical protein
MPTDSPPEDGPAPLLSSPWLWIGAGLVLTVLGLVLLLGLRRAQ